MTPCVSIWPFLHFAEERLPVFSIFSSHAALSVVLLFVCGGYVFAFSPVGTRDHRYPIHINENYLLKETFPLTAKRNR